MTRQTTQITTTAQGATKRAYDKIVKRVSDDGMLSPVYARTLPLRRIALEHRQFMGAFHPFDPVGRLDLRLRRNQVGIVVGRALDIDDPRQHLRIFVEE